MVRLAADVMSELCGSLSELRFPTNPNPLLDVVSQPTPHRLAAYFHQPSYRKSSPAPNPFHPQLWEFTDFFAPPVQGLGLRPLHPLQVSLHGRALDNTTDLPRSVWLCSATLRSRFTVAAVCRLRFIQHLQLTMMLILLDRAQPLALGTQ